MSSFFVDLWESIFTPGPTTTLLKATNVTFFALQTTLATLLIATYNVHFIVLNFLCAGLWWSINWFAAELAVVQKEQQRKEAAAKLQRQQQEEEAAANKNKDDDGGATSDTEVEDNKVPRSKGKKREAKGAKEDVVKADVEVVEVKGEVKRRTDGTQSSASTEDEWEKVSENENEKDK